MSLLTTLSTAASLLPIFPSRTASTPTHTPVTFDTPLHERSAYPVVDCVPRVPVTDVIGVFPDHSAWNYHIDFEVFDVRAVTGWLPTLPEDGDLFAHESTPGKFTVYRLTDITYRTGTEFTARALDIGELETYVDLSRTALNTRYRQYYPEYQVSDFPNDSVSMR